MIASMDLLLRYFEYNIVLHGMAHCSTLRASLQHPFLLLACPCPCFTHSVWQNRDESLGVTDAPIDARMASHRAEEEEASMEMTTFAQEDPEDWGDDDGWGDDDDGWGDKWSENDDAPKVRPTSADEARQNARFNNNR